MYGSRNSFDRGLKQTIDWRVILCYIALVIIGCVSIYAAIQAREPASIFDDSSGKQLLWFGISAVFAVIVLFALNPKFWEAIAPLSYVLVVILLIVVRFVSSDVKGSHSWFDLGPIRFQPAEVSKITTSLMLALVMSMQGFKISKTADFFKVVAVICVPMLAILLENETGSALVYIGYLFVLYREGLSGWWIVALGMAILLFILTLTTSRWVAMIVLGVVCLLYCILALRNAQRRSRIIRRNIILRALGGFAAGVILIFATDIIFHKVLHDYQRGRIEVLLGLKEDPAGVGYNVRQSMIAIGSGGFFGKGFLNGTQTTFGFVPEQSTDFIFCTIGEEWGFFGCLVIILLYVYLIYRIIQSADKSRESFTRIYGYCVASCLFMHLFINIGMTIGLMPVIGIPLPMLSYGGSSLLAFTLQIFIFLALNRQENKYF